MKKKYITPLIASLALFATFANGQLLGPVDPDAAGYAEANIGGSVFAVGGDMTTEINVVGLNNNFGSLDPDTVYKWCLEVVAEYIPTDGGDNGDISLIGDLEDLLELKGRTTSVETKTVEGLEGLILEEEVEFIELRPSGLFETAFEIGEATPGQALGFLNGAASTAPDFMSEIPGISGINWPAPFGLAPEDIFFEYINDGPVTSLYFQSEVLDPEIFVSVIFKGEARLSAKPAPGVAVPEPSTYGLMGAGFLILLVAIRKKIKPGKQ